MAQTVIKSASVKVMLSYNYNHFESSMVIENEDGLDFTEIDESRKICQRLCDKAVGQYKIAKDLAAKRINAKYDKEKFVKEVESIKLKPIGERTVDELAKLKAFDDDSWSSQFNYDYDYEDECDYEDENEDDIRW